LDAIPRLGAFSNPHARVKHVLEGAHDFRALGVAKDNRDIEIKPDRD
jgi:hypothetical protein